MDSFKIDLQGIGWTFASHKNDVNLGFEAFLQLFHAVLDKHPPIKKELTKQKKNGLPKE